MQSLTAVQHTGHMDTAEDCSIQFITHSVKFIHLPVQSFLIGLSNKSKCYYDLNVNNTNRCIKKIKLTFDSFKAQNFSKKY